MPSYHLGFNSLVLASSRTVSERVRTCKGRPQKGQMETIDIPSVWTFSIKTSMTEKYEEKIK